MGKGRGNPVDRATCLRASVSPQWRTGSQDEAERDLKVSIPRVIGHRAAEPEESGFETGILRDVLARRRMRLGGWPGRPRDGPAPRTQAHRLDGPPAEERVDALDDEAVHVLDLQRIGARAAEDERAAGVAPTAPPHLLRHGEVGEALADDRVPLREEASVGEAALAHQGIERLLDEVAKAARAVLHLRTGLWQRRTHTGLTRLDSMARPPHKRTPRRGRLASPVPQALPEIKTDAVADVLVWYDRHRRKLPWRAGVGEASDPYRVWVSEIMLQQTTVAAVKGYYARFLARFPTVEALAEAELDEVFRLWAGLGYYARARNLHACARHIVAGGGVWPRTVEGLRALPGVGPYTAAAIGALCFGTPDLPLDANIERVVARLERFAMPIPKGREALRRVAQAYRAPERPGDMAQAMMDVGATICTPRAPACALCPLRPHCAAFAAGDVDRYPVKAPRRAVPEKRGTAHVARRPDGAILMRRRPSEGLLGGLWLVPVWWPGEDGSSAPPFDADWTAAGEARHGFTHFKLVLDVFVAEVAADAPDGFAWMRPDEIGQSTLLRTILEAAKRSGPDGETDPQCPPANAPVRTP